MAATAPSILLRKGLAVVAGIGFAAVPAVGPFLALLAINATRFEIQRADRWWWLAAFLLGAPLLLGGDVAAGLWTMAQVVAVWLVLRSVSEFRRAVDSPTIPIEIGFGLVVGLAITLALGAGRIDGVVWQTARTPLDAIVWRGHPTLFGHSMLVLSAVIAVIVPSPRLRLAALWLGAVAVLLSGAREAAIAWLVVALVLQFLEPRAPRGTRLAAWLAIAVVSVIVVGLGATLGVGRTGFLTEVVAGTTGPNVFRGTEVAAGDWWLPLGVSYTSGSATIDGEERTTFAVTKTWTEAWARLQQVVKLEPGRSYTLSAVWRTAAGVQPGFDGWGSMPAGRRPATLSFTAGPDGVRTAAVAPLVVDEASATDLGDGWTRGVVTFRYEGETALPWYVGAVVDRSTRAGATTEFAEFQLTATDHLVAYVPGHAERGVVDLRTSRFPIWRDALDAIAARPWLGWGAGGLPEAIVTLHPGVQRVRPVAAHAHDMLLDVAVKQGLVGVAGLLLLVALLVLRIVQQRDKAMAAVMGGVVLLNVFDATLLSGEVVYVLAAALGWRAVGLKGSARAETGIASAFAVRAALAVADVAAAALTLSAAMLVVQRLDASVTLATGWSSALLYATLAWPAVSAWSGLYPGYGRPFHDELARSVRAAAVASILLGFAVFLLPDSLRLPASVIAVVAVASPILAPVARALTKIGLRRMRLWGRPVVVLGTGPEAERTARHLLHHPGIGLHPVAVFGDGTTWNLGALPVTGTLAHTWTYLRTHNIRHAIVTPDAAAELAFDDMLIRADRQLHYVQYLPDLRGLPTNSVAATPLGTALGLEVRNQLASGTNRAVKRVIDVLGATLLLAVLGVPLALIALAIRLDSRGSPFYLSPRVGRYGRTFSCVKFRTMHVDADERLQRLLAADPDLHEEYEHYHKLENDPRVTRIGRLLRRGSIDELPQLWNVLKGDMSLVGPRPYLVRELGDMSRLKDLIFLARPGMTGYWQVEARNDVGFDERQVMEAHYVRNWSVWWDIEILLRTPAAILDRTGK